MGISRKILGTVVLSLAILFGSESSADYKEVKNPAKLTVEFAGGKWDGKRVPSDQVCFKYITNRAKTPPLKVGNIPAGTTHIIVSFNDETYGPMCCGGHGAVRFKVDGNAIAALPAVPAETSDLPDGVETESAHSGPYGSGAYLPPCSGGRGNTYSADVKAVSVSTGKSGKLLGKGKIYLGDY